MRKLTARYLPLLPVFLALGASLFTHSCANTTQAPTGGDKDTIPPVILKVSPPMGKCSVPVHGTQVTFTFNEYVKVKEPKALYLSPPMQRPPKFKVRGKSVIVYFEEDLQENTTYTLDLTGAIADNNEGNLFPGFTAVFSTGPSIDTLLLTGTVVDCNTLKPIQGATVMLYKDHADSAVFLHRPFASIKTDDWGYFALRNIQDTLYRLYAVVDGNNNNLYDPDEDRIAFCDTLVRPTMAVVDSLPELMKYDMKDTLHCLARTSQMTLCVFRERPSRQMVMNKMRLGDRSAYVTFNAPGTQIDSLWFKGISVNRVIAQFNPRRDSLELWVNDPRKMPDTLQLNIRYWKTDTAGFLSPFTEKINLIDENRPKGRQQKKKLEHADTICQLSLTAKDETLEQEGFTIEFTLPPVFGHFDSLVFKSVNPKQQESVEKFTWQRDSLNLRKYSFHPSIQLLDGFDYIFKVPARTFQDIRGFWNDSTQVKVSLPKDENLSSLTLRMTGVGGRRYIVDLLNEKRNETLRSYQIEADSELTFPYLRKGKYSLRITEDVNRNGIVDTGSLLGHRQPEKVKFLLFDKSDTVEIPEKSDLSQDVDLTDLFKD